MNKALEYFLSFIVLISILMIFAGVIVQQGYLILLGAIIAIVVGILARILARPGYERARREEEARKAAIISETMNMVKSGHGPVGWSGNPRLGSSDACPNCGLKHILDVKGLGKSLLRESHPRNSSSSYVYNVKQEVKCRNCGFHVIQSWEEKEYGPWSPDW